ncbi:AAA family ATPase [Crocinitomicaceae bacterium]|nr:AAA family ATPase [Crocinitomicaceae bacterium]
MKFKIENFALFEKSTTFDLAPLTLLIGANSSGKSSFLKALDISHGIDFNSRYFDLNAISDYLNNNTQFEVPVFKNVNLRLRFEGVDAPDDFCGWVSPIVEYVDEDSNLIISLKFSPSEIKNQRSMSQIIVGIDLMRFRNLIINYHDSLGMTKSAYDAFKIWDPPILNTDFTWIFGDNNSKKITFDAILGLFNLEEEFQSKELTEITFPFDVINELDNEGFHTLIDSFEDALLNFFAQLNPEKLNFHENYDAISYIIRTIFITSSRNRSKNISGPENYHKEIFRTSKLGKADRIYFEGHPFFQILKDYIYHTSECVNSKSIGEWFVKKWMHRFFSSDTQFNVKIIKDRRRNTIAYEYELGSKDLVEWGTGAYRVIQLIYILARHLAVPSYVLPDESSDPQGVLEDVLSQASQNALHWQSRGFLDQELIVFEEPEMNLHPDYQSVLAEMFFDFSRYHFSTLVIETHSEYVIRTFQYLRSKEDSFSKDTCCIVNFGVGKELGCVKNIKIEEDGSLSDSFYSGFMNHSQDLLLKLLTLNSKISNN